MALELSSWSASEHPDEVAGPVAALLMLVQEASRQSLGAAVPRFAALTAALTTVEDIVDTSEDVDDALLRMSWFRLATCGGMSVCSSERGAADVSSAVNCSISWGIGAPLGSFAVGLRNSSKKG
jgi:hypothetical protein